MAKYLTLFLSMFAIAVSAAPELNMLQDPLENYHPPVGRIAGLTTALRFSRGEAGMAAFSIFNPSDRTMYCRLELKGLEPLAPVIREAVHIRARLGQLPADVLPKISADAIVLIPAGENRQIFIDLDTRKPEAGQFQGTLRAVDISTGKAAEQTFTVTILPLVLPEKHPLSVMTWDCSLRGATGAGREKMLAMLQESYVNTFHVLERPVLKDGKWDFTAVNAAVNFLKDKGLCLLRLAAPPKGMDIMTEPGVKAYREYIKAAIENLKNEGFDYSEYVFYPYDENTSDLFFAAAKAIKEADSQALVYVDPTPKSTSEELRRLLDGNYVDYIQFSSSLNRDRHDMTQSMIGKTRYSSAYWCPVIQKRLQPGGFYRRMGHYAYRYNLNGIGYWTSLWMPGSDKWGIPWDDFRGKTASSVTIYPARDNNSESIPSRRWRAFRAGLEDYWFFDLIRRRGTPELQKKVNAAAEFPQNSAALALLKTEIINFLTEKQ